ncbi:MAG TPA: hypothetical protein VMY37_23190 [Thermoguttaceae bacterium]|nr:hypothetical protein [Thermoguttaceae bacterium]
MTSTPAEGYQNGSQAAIRRRLHREGERGMMGGFLLPADRRGASIP